MKCLYVLFDAECELCVRCRNQLMQQPAIVPLVFIAFQSDEAQRRFPGIDALKPEEQLLLISDKGAVYRAANAWIMCLWALENYREHTQRLGHQLYCRSRNSSANCSVETASSYRMCCSVGNHITRLGRLLPIMIYTKRRGRMWIADYKRSYLPRHKPGRHNFLCRPFASCP